MTSSSAITPNRVHGCAPLSSLNHKQMMPATPALILGIDGGGTKTVAWLSTADPDGPLLGQGHAGPSNQRAVGPVLATQNLDLAVQLAFDNAGLERQTVPAACLGLAGADRQADRQVVLQWAEHARLAERVRVVNDAVPLLSANHGSGIGVALIAGTGSLAWGRNAAGQTARSGGWGYLLGDEGSAFALGTAAIKAVVMAADGRSSATTLRDPLLQALHISSTADIVTAIYSADIPRAVIAGLAPLLFQPELAADTAVQSILQQAANDLATMTASVARQLQLVDPFPLALTGSVLLHQPQYRQAVIQAITDLSTAPPSVSVVPEAVAGALQLARDLLLSP